MCNQIYFYFYNNFKQIRAWFWLCFPTHFKKRFTVTYIYILAKWHKPNVFHIHLYSYFFIWEHNNSSIVPHGTAQMQKEGCTGASRVVQKYSGDTTLAPVNRKSNQDVNWTASIFSNAQLKINSWNRGKKANYLCEFIFKITVFKSWQNISDYIF